LVSSLQGNKCPGKLAAKEIFNLRQKSAFAGICITKVLAALDPAELTRLQRCSIGIVAAGSSFYFWWVGAFLMEAASL